MPLYEYYENADNIVKLSNDSVEQVIIGTQAVSKAICAIAEKGAIAIDGWYGVEWNLLKDEISNSLKELGKKAYFMHAYDFYVSKEEINQYQKEYETEDPSFGWVNSTGVLNDLIDEKKVKEVQKVIEMNRAAGTITIIYGPGAAIEAIRTYCDAVIYADYTMQPMLWKMWDALLEPFGYKDVAKDYYWKKYYYNDFYLLYKQKKTLFTCMDYYIDAVHSDCLKMLPVDVYNNMIDEVVKSPIKQVKILQPGPWGAYRYKDLWKVDGLECNAWNELAGIELSVQIDIGVEKKINIPAQNIMQRPIQMVGEYVNKKYPDLMPLQVWLDDGYFEEEMPLERVCMPIHDHPSTSYVKEHFNEPLGRYETYYIVESYKNSATLMGYKEDCNLEEWERLCKESSNLIPISNWQDYISRWDTNVGDLFLIPPGTSHGHGGNQMILEMDTGPSIAGTEYSFFTYDFARSTWDDNKKSMTAKPMKMHLKHSFDNQKWIREGRVQAHHRARPIAVDGNGKFRKDQYTTLPEQPFHIERIFFEERAVNDTEGKYMQIVTLVEGKKVTIRSLDNPQYSTTIDRLQACILPAGFGKHEYINEDGSHAMVVFIRLKEG